jgi:hypothetical protein
LKRNVKVGLKVTCEDTVLPDVAKDSVRGHKLMGTVKNVWILLKARDFLYEISCARPIYTVWLAPPSTRINSNKEIRHKVQVMNDILC